MKKSTPKRTLREDLRPEYDFTGGVRGKYAQSFQQGTNLVLLDPEISATFPDSDSVNEALRALLAISRRARNTRER